jgi:hypothetical protein
MMALRNTIARACDGEKTYFEKWMPFKFFLIALSSAQTFPQILH